MQVEDAGSRGQKRSSVHLEGWETRHHCERGPHCLVWRRHCGLQRRGQLLFKRLLIFLRPLSRQRRLAELCTARFCVRKLRLQPTWNLRQPDHRSLPGRVTQKPTGGSSHTADCMHAHANVQHRLLTRRPASGLQVSFTCACIISNRLESSAACHLSAPTSSACTHAGGQLDEDYQSAHRTMLRASLACSMAQRCTTCSSARMTDESPR